MGPPLSHRETRRSGRRSAPSVSKSVSKSPETEIPPSKQKEKETPASRPPLSSNHSSSRSKRPKLEEIDDNSEEQKSGSISSNSNASGKSKRKNGSKEKQQTVEPSLQSPSEEDSQPQEPEQEDEEEQGVTRCVCGSTGEDDPDAGEFMVQCEGCKVWQHGLCMGFESEDQLPDDDYYCEECDPDRHKDRLSKRRSRRPRQASTTANAHNAVNNRVSRSHSPSSLRQPSKRRNTMNSRDAAFDESLKEVLEATAAEAAAHDITTGVTTDPRPEQTATEEDNDTTSNKKKRKRVDDETSSKKRTRSASTASDQPPSAAAHEEPPEQAKSMPPPKSTSRPNKRGGGKKAPPPLTIDNVSVDGDEGTAKRPTQSRTKSAQKSAQPSNNGGTVQDAGSRRGQGTPGNATPSTNTESGRNYRSIHSAAQQSLFTSWNLPDYLAHLEPILPSHIPPPLEVRSSSTGQTNSGKGESVELTMERGVKVKWPSKRMSVGDMNKRVRALVEWVGREQASALDRIRRQEALNQVLQGGDVSTTALDNVTFTESDSHANSNRNELAETEEGDKLASITSVNRGLSDVQSTATMKLMEELMEELIGFQERFGPGSRNRERRIVSN